MKKFDSFDDWAQAQSPEHRKVISKLRKLTANVAPGLVETSKWGNGCWVKGELPILFLHAEKSHLQFGFFAGAKLSDPQNLLKGTGKFVRHIRIQSPNDVDEKALSTMIRKAVRAPAYR